MSPFSFISFIERKYLEELVHTLQTVEWERASLVGDRGDNVIAESSRRKSHKFEFVEQVEFAEKNRLHWRGKANFTHEQPRKATVASLVVRGSAQPQGGGTAPSTSLENDQGAGHQERCEED
jgi:hypothetical protein